MAIVGTDAGSLIGRESHRRRCRVQRCDWGGSARGIDRAGEVACEIPREATLDRGGRSAQRDAPHMPVAKNPKEPTALAEGSGVDGIDLGTGREEPQGGAESLEGLAGKPDLLAAAHGFRFGGDCGGSAAGDLRVRLEETAEGDREGQAGIEAELHADPNLRGGCLTRRANRSRDLGQAGCGGVWGAGTMPDRNWGPGVGALGGPGW